MQKIVNEEISILTRTILRELESQTTEENISYADGMKNPENVDVNVEEKYANLYKKIIEFRSIFAYKNLTNYRHRITYKGENDVDFELYLPKKINGNAANIAGTIQDVFNDIEKEFNEIEFTDSEKKSRIQKQINDYKNIMNKEVNAKIKDQIATANRQAAISGSNDIDELEANVNIQNIATPVNAQNNTQTQTQSNATNRRRVVQRRTFGDKVFDGIQKIREGTIGHLDDAADSKNWDNIKKVVGSKALHILLGAGAIGLIAKLIYDNALAMKAGVNAVGAIITTGAAVNAPQILLPLVSVGLFSALVAGIVWYGKKKKQRTQRPEPTQTATPDHDNDQSVSQTMTPTLSKEQILAQIQSGLQNARDAKAQRIIEEQKIDATQEAIELAETQEKQAKLQLAKMILEHISLEELEQIAQEQQTQSAGMGL